MKINHALLTVGLMLASSVPGQDVMQLVSECEDCHGPGGVSSDADVPSLAGKSVNYIREILGQFYRYERHCRTTTFRHGDRAKTPMNMCRVAQDLSDDDKQAVAEYFARAGSESARE